ncbi:hypothetical protein Cni_G27906 [Canna indica]|uniref:Bidirectional sugar transporter SWEET n=1 Tax=Canna indica TaxID=4628 RepID=A0AAQ3QPS4_9LILI|nr:hypothetical protein Cni_G27906 [Canna indica]
MIKKNSTLLLASALHRLLLRPTPPPPPPCLRPRHRVHGTDADHKGGNIISFGLFLSSAPTFIQIIKQKAVEKYSPVPYLTTLHNCMLWTFYDLLIVHPDNLLVITINDIGLALETFYLTIFILYSTHEGRLKVFKILAVEIPFVVVVIVTVLLTTHTYEKWSLIVDVLYIIFGTCMYAAPLLVMKLMIQTKSVKYMPFTLSMASFLNRVCWTANSFLPFDINILVPNGLGTLLALLYLSLPLSD